MIAQADHAPAIAIIASPDTLPVGTSVTSDQLAATNEHYFSLPAFLLNASP
jgi:hypothetical protein